MNWQPAPLKHAMAALIMSPHQYDAMTLRDAIKGPGTNEKKLNEILATRSKQVSLYSFQFPFPSCNDINFSKFFRNLVTSLRPMSRVST
jgi:hypothetical protein